MPQQHDAVSRIFENNSNSYDFDVRLFTLGMDNLWKQNMFREIQASGRQYSRILDLACGTGIITFDLAKRYPDAQIIGVDITPDYLQVAETKKDGYGIENVTFVNMPAEDLLSSGRFPSSQKFDLIVTSYLPKYSDLDTVVSSCSALLSPGGVLVFHDFTKPRNTTNQMLYKIYWTLLTPILSIANWKDAPTELYNIIDKSTWDQDICPLLERNGFTDIKFEWQPLQVAAIVAARKA